jgi:hypothetical protein
MASDKQIDHTISNGIENVHMHNIEGMQSRHVVLMELFRGDLQAAVNVPDLDLDRLAGFWQWSDAVVKMPRDQRLALIYLTVYFDSLSLRDMADQRHSGYHLFQLAPSMSIFGNVVPGQYVFKLAVCFLRDHRNFFVDNDEKFLHDLEGIKVMLWEVRNAFSGYVASDRLAIRSEISIALEEPAYSISQGQQVDFGNINVKPCQVVDRTPLIQAITQDFADAMEAVIALPFNRDDVIATMAARGFAPGINAFHADGSGFSYNEFDWECKL